MNMLVDLPDPSEERVAAALKRLQLTDLRDTLAAVLSEAAKEKWTYLEFLDRILGREVDSKQGKRIQMGMQIAHFPCVRTIKTFDFSADFRGRLTCLFHTQFSPRTGRFFPGFLAFEGATWVPFRQVASDFCLAAPAFPPPFIPPPTLPKPLHFGLFAHNTLPLPLGPNGSQDVPRGLATCLIGTQQPMARSQELAHLFQQPDSPAHRHYEICRAYFYESAPADEIAKRFHLHS